LAEGVIRREKESKMADYAIANPPYALNVGETRFGWSFNGQYDALSFRSGSAHFDIPGITATAGANPIGNGVYAGAVAGGASSVFSSTPAYGATNTVFGNGLSVSK
jgi:hypothetical protein